MYKIEYNLDWNMSNLRRVKTVYHPTKPTVAEMKLIMDKLGVESRDDEGLSITKLSFGKVYKNS